MATTGLNRSRARAGPTRHPAALVAFDDFEASGLVQNPLTIIGYDNHALGRRAAEVLFRRVAGDGSSPEQIMLPTELRHVRLTS